MRSASPEQQEQIAELLQEIRDDVDRLRFLLTKILKNRKEVLQILDEIEGDDRK